LNKLPLSTHDFIIYTLNYMELIFQLDKSNIKLISYYLVFIHL